MKIHCIPWTERQQKSSASLQIVKIRANWHSPFPTESRDTISYAFGSREKGELRNGTTGDRVTAGNKTTFDSVYEYMLVKGFGVEKIMHLSSCQQPSIALNEKSISSSPRFSEHRYFFFFENSESLLPSLTARHI
ncbi:uncharacterized protein EV420DRAFT_161353 [Desarmillaria tabescens]|uniref:Uncharacterized protein n=1 Tax=Armillaria tabescens TaxID=1929756 RepID=A0AA39J7H6_ARMTA|nr:uncharacterized protein EV420DRAFT_161353 [Desarmillaria tabescens]KAK0437590.1 hypothetical protein EV420DRAFT_161353 [Desarmillaria tabescens]